MLMTLVQLLMKTDNRLLAFNSIYLFFSTMTNLRYF